MESSAQVLGLDIGGTNIRLGIVGKDLRVTNMEIKPTYSVYRGGNTAERLADLIADYLEKNDPAKKVSVIAAGFPSLVDKKRRVLISSTNLPGLDGTDIVALLENRLSLPVIIDHDAYFLLANDILVHHVSASETALGFYFGTGMGNALYIDGKPYVGKHGAACEIGHMPVALGTRECSCGNRGCIEMYCCGKSLEHIAQTCFPDVPIKKVFLTDSRSDILNQFIRYMAVPVATEINMLDPDIIFIGGGIVYMEGFPKQQLLSCIMDNVRHPLPYDDTKIIYSENSQENGLVGAAVAGFRYLAEKM